MVIVMAIVTVLIFFCGDEGESYDNRLVKIMMIMVMIFGDDGDVGRW